MLVLVGLRQTADSSSSLVLVLLLLFAPRPPSSRRPRLHLWVDAWLVPQKAFTNSTFSLFNQQQLANTLTISMSICVSVGGVSVNQVAFLSGVLASVGRCCGGGGGGVSDRPR